jgi:hypothetical protein
MEGSVTDGFQVLAPNQDSIVYNGRPIVHISLLSRLVPTYILISSPLNSPAPTYSYIYIIACSKSVIVEKNAMIDTGGIPRMSAL